MNEQQIGNGGRKRMRMFNNSLIITNQSTTIFHYVNLQKNGELNLNAEYQRPYVWTMKEEVELLDSVFQGIPIGSTSVILHEATNKEPYCEVVDGKQRIMALLRFINNEFPVYDTFHCEMSEIEQRQLRNCHLSQNVLYVRIGEVSLAQKLTYFERLNWGGVEQDSEHRQTIRQLRNLELNKGENV